MEYLRATAQPHHQSASTMLREASAAQREIWLAQRLNPNCSFAIGLYAEIDGDVNQDVLERAVAVVVDETPALRARFEIVGDQLRDSLDSSIGSLFTVINLSHVDRPKSQGLAQALAWIREDLSRPRLAEDGDLCAFVLIRLGARHFVWYQRYHHILVDGRSVALIAKRIAEIYSLVIEGRALPSPSAFDPSLLSETNTNYRMSSRFRADRDFWKEYLDGDFCPAWLSRASSTDSGRPRSYNEVVTAYRETERLIGAAGQIGVSHTQIWVAAVAIHFHVLIGKTDLQFSLPVANCTRSEEDTPGMTSNVLPLRLRVRPTDSLSEVARETAKVTKRLLRHQRYRGEDIRRDNYVKQDGWFGPAINLMNFDGGAPFPGCLLSWHAPSLGPVYDFSIAIIDYGDGEGQQIILKDVAAAHTENDLQAHARGLIQVLDAFLEQPEQTVEVLKKSLTAHPKGALDASFYARRGQFGEAGCLRWNSRAQSLANVVRALGFGDYCPNPLGLPKILLGDRIVCVTQLEVMAQQSGAPPGTLLKVEQGRWQVATDTEDVVISGFISLGGEVLNPEVLALQLCFGAGDCLPLIDDEQAKALTEAYEAVVPHEFFWLERLGRCRSLYLPYEQSNTVSSTPKWQVSAWHIPGVLGTLAPDRRFEYLLTVWMIYLARITGETSLQVGWMVSSNKSNIPWMSGFFAPHVPMEIDFDLEESLSQALTRVKNEHTELENHHTYVCDLVLRYSQLKSFEALRSPRAWRIAVALVQSCGCDSTGSSTTPASNSFCATDACGELLTLEISTFNGNCRWIYDSTRLNVEQLERMTQHLQVLMQAVMDPSAADTPIGQLDILPSEERRLVLERWNATEAPYPEDKCIHELFEEQVRKSAETTAVVYEDQSLGYGELNAEANRLAHHLIGLGVKPDDRVGICVERSLAMVVGLIGILKAGGGYVPLDPAYPSGRLKQILDDAGPAMVLIDGAGREALGEEALEGLRVVDVGRLGQARTLPPEWAELPATDPDVKVVGVTSQHLAYVIYTSGSTGTPKGVMVEHKSVINLWLGLEREIYGKGLDCKRVSMNASLGFDASIKQLIQMLSGRTLVIVSQEVRFDGEALLRFAEHHRIDALDCTPSQMGGLLGAGLLGEKGYKPKTVLVGGEVIDQTMWRALADTADVRFYNVYGPTECTVDSTIANVKGTNHRPHIGRPIANTRIYILDGYGQPVPMGAVGEIYIGGAGVARGYLNRAELTEECFVRDPFSRVPGGRMYKSGDLGRYQADGKLVFVGRNDQQVKIRGFRIELGEIEAALAAHPGVREAVVMEREDAAGEKRLVGYVVLAKAGGGEFESRHGLVTDAAELAGALRRHVAARLPEYMVPAAFVRLDVMPLTVNGKVDRKALPEAEGEAYAQRRYEAPRGEIEQSLAGVWEEVLGVEGVGRHDHFFELGGHSLLAVRLLARVRQELGVELAMMRLFAGPTLAEMAEAVREGGARGEQQALPEITAVTREGGLELSFAQQRLWFLAQMEDVSATYHVPAALRLRGELDRTALRRSLDAMFARHEALRSVFVGVDGEARVEVLASEKGVPMIEDDLRGVAEASERLKELEVEEAEGRFDLAQGPLIRARLIRLDEQEYVFLVTQHHIVSDGWSMGVFARELGDLYRAFSREEPNPLAPLAIQYADYAAWQRGWLSGERLESQADYWRQKLGGAPVLLELPTDRGRPPRQSFAGGNVPIRIDGELTKGLKELSGRYGATLFMTLLSAWAAVLSRLSGQEEVVIGTPSANRGRQETEGLIGFFVNTLALRVDLSNEPSVAEVLARVRETALGGQDHQDVPFEQVVEMMQPVRRLNQTPLFQVMFAWENNELRMPDLPGVRVERAWAAYEVAKFDLELGLYEEGDSIVGRLNYATALFDEATIKRQRGYLLRVLKAMAADSEQAVAGIDLLGPEERRLVLERWNATEAPYPEDKCIHELFEEQVRKSAETTAVVYEDQSLGYGELNAEANRLAHHLIGLGVKPDDRVGICVERSLAMVVGLIGILKAGGGYVPLDPAYPSGRLKQILDDAGPAMVLIDGAGREALGEEALEGLRVVDVGRLGQARTLPPEWAELPATDPDVKVVGVTSQHLAYVIYTSGSTGTPKGVMVEHKSVINLWLGLEREIYGKGLDCKRVSMNASLGFDASIKQLIQMLSGRTLVIVSQEVRFDGEALLRFAEHHRIDALDCTPSQMGGLLGAGLLGEKGYKPKTVLVGGEVIDQTMWRALADTADVRFYNVYGPTECTVDSTIANVKGTNHRPHIGRPIANTRIYILDGYGQPVPMGAVGEIYIGGAGVARGYLNRAELTEECFVRDPFSRVPGGRMYKSGDLGRYQADGKLVFVGRNDQQVKIRGFRIELGEIEAALAAHPGVREAVVMEREDAAGEKRLVGYVVLAKAGGGEFESRHGLVTDAAELAGALRRHVAARLPEYMVPAAFVRLDVMPLTVNGKVDRKALPEAEGEAYAQRRYEAPRGEIEQSLAGVWEEVLGVEGVGRHDHFFELGGHSLLAVRLLARVRQELGVELAMMRLFAGPTLAEMAEAVREGGARGEQQALPEITAVTREGGLELSFAQQRLWFLAQMEDVSATYHVPAALRLRGELDRTALRRSLDAMFARHEALRSVFVGVDGEARVEVLASEKGVPMIEDDLRGVAEASERLKELEVEEAEGRFDLAQGPLIRARLIRLDEQEYVFLVTQHHIVSDGWSMGVFARELGDLYRAFSREEPNPLAPLAIQYADYAAWQRGWLSGERLESQADYWRQKLGGAPVLLELPTDRGRPPRQSFAGGNVPIRIDGELTKGLKELSGRYGATLFMTLLSAWAAVLSRLSGQEEVVIGTPSANRGRQETEGLIGFFVNTLALRVDLSNEPSVAEVLARVRETALGGQDHQDVPFEQVVEMMQPVRRLNQTPLFQVMFAWENNELRMPDLPGVRVERAWAAYEVAKFDLELGLYEEGDSIVGRLNYATALFDEATIKRQRGYLLRVLKAMAADSEQAVAGIDLLGPEERRLVLERWNATEAPYPEDKCIHELFEQEAARVPEAAAVICGGEHLTYRRLNERANQLAHYLMRMGVGPESLVGVCLGRSVELMVALLGILKAGGAYLPLDPGYPRERLSFMLGDARAMVLVTEGSRRESFNSLRPRLVAVDSEWEQIEACAKVNPTSAVTAENLAYVIYTSGSTGQPKGVMVYHENVVNFFTGMDSSIGCDPSGTWLAVTSISFDISVLELLWTVARGFAVVIQSDPVRNLKPVSSRHQFSDKKMDFSLFYFASDENEAVVDKYQLLIEGAKFADRNGFTAVWTPERHFHAFGGLYPNPSVTSAVVAAITQQVKIRAGSVVLPLHNPIRVAEEWSVVDNVSKGRVGISFASGWHSQDFVLAPHNFGRRKDVMMRDIEAVRKLWRGDSILVPVPAGNEIEVKILPRPVQPELPIWLTAAGNPETFSLAGEIGANLLTHLLGQSIEELAEKIAIYRQAWQRGKHGSGAGHVTLMLHTFIGDDLEIVREKVRKPFSDYLKSSVGLMQDMRRSLGYDPSIEPSGADIDLITAKAFDRYFGTSGLMGTPETCLEMVERLKGIGVDEIGCLIDFGVDYDAVMTGLSYLNVLRERSNEQRIVAAHNDSLAAQMSRHAVSHLQCTPSMAKMLALDAQARDSMGALQHVMLGGEELPAGLVKELENFVTGDMHNMYGPTETTIWSATYQIEKADGRIPIGRPISNTQIYILDRLLRPVPVGTPGDVFIGGIGVVRGYLSRPDLTAVKFIPDPFSPRRGARFYLTGDRGRYLQDGNLVFLGRNDQQVKIRGFRIELGEIEARLAEHPLVGEAVVMAREDAPGEKRLVAYVVAAKAEEGESASPQGLVTDATEMARTLRRYVAGRLPEYMVPAAFVRLDSLPLTPNGKLDRKALPAPEGEAYARRGYEAPQGEMERTLAGVWQELLGVERVGRHDQFFELGGHSLQAVRLLARVRQVLRVELPMATLFAGPTLAQMAQAVTEAGARGDLQALPAITAVSRRGAQRLSFAQQRLWFLAQMEDVSATYHVPAALRLRGELDRTALRRSLDAMFARHETLRSVFVAVDGQPRVKLLPSEMGVPMVEHDLRGVPEALERLKELEVEEAGARFDLAQGPLIRARLIRLDEQEHVFLMTQHHIVSDGWSMGVFARELGELYRAFSRDEPNPLAPLAIQYPDYAAWQRRWLGGERLERQIDYWRQTLAGAPVLLELPTDRVRGERQSFAGANIPIYLDGELTEGLKELSGRHGVTLFMTLLSSWAAVLSRLSGQEEVVIGTPTANRGREETEGLIGFFVNTLALRVDLSNEPSMAEFLARVRGTALGAQDHQDLPFEQVVELVQPPRRLNHTPLFQVMFAWQNHELGMPDLPGVRVEPAGTTYEVARFDLELDLYEEGETVVGRLNYGTALFDEATIKRQRGYLLRVLKAMVADSEQAVAGIDLLGPEERRLVLESWNATEAPYPEDMCIQQLFEEQVRKSPEATAVLYEGQSLRYGELNEWANRLAHHLIGLGVKPDDRVAICVERSLAMVVGLLGILKAGGAYVPLDPAYPTGRLKQILDDAGPAMVLIDGAGREALGEEALEGLRVVDVDRLAHARTLPPEWAELPATDPDVKVVGVTSQHLAYVIYTSGSTGTPKGVMNEHHALINRLIWMQEAYGLDSTDVVLQKTSFSFDVSVWEFFWTLLNGATLAVAPPEAHKDPLHLIELIRKWRVTTVHFVPSMLGPFANTEGIERCTPLRRLICSGEALPALHVHAYQHKLPGSQLYNLYGPTEAAIDVTAWTCPSSFSGAIVPIGRPIANTRIYILDEHCQPVPLGAAGEMYIGGAGVARGYLNRPDLTEERFLRDPFSSVPRARMYKTGDLARYLPDGNIEFLGRNDQQVKIRGFRIELGEIEALLAEHPLVRQTVVLAREDGLGEKGLVAYVVPATAKEGRSESHQGSVTDPAELARALRRHLAGRLPEYMVPAAFARLEMLPLTPNGKLDRNALPAPEVEAYARRGYEEPQGEMEQTLAALWEELLGVERVGRHDQFFELGGHSLLAVRLIERLRRLSLQIEISAMFASPILSDLALKISEVEEIRL
jgi:natural product biosynthesis luciferase-like monooxygenase protein/amino acid adenylation domain-containing protein